MSRPECEAPGSSAAAQLAAMGERLPLIRRATTLLASAGDLEQVMEHTIAACLPALGDFGVFDLHVGDERRSRPAIPVAESSTPVHARLLIVDDNIDAADLLGELLRTHGYQVQVATSGDRAVALLADFAPDAAILDIGLPGMDGYELARRIRADRRHGRMRLVALTGYGRDVDREHARDAGFDEHLVKPVRPHDLMQTLSRLLT